MKNITINEFKKEIDLRISYDFIIKIKPDRLLKKIENGDFILQVINEFNKYKNAIKKTVLLVITVTCKSYSTKSQL